MGLQRALVSLRSRSSQAGVSASREELLAELAEGKSGVRNDLALIERKQKLVELLLRLLLPEIRHQAESHRTALPAYGSIRVEARLVPLCFPNRFALVAF